MTAAAPVSGPAARLRARLSRPEPLAAPGAHDALSARLCEAAGFEAVFVSGAGVTFSRFAKPDLAFVTLDEMAQVVRAMRLVCELPLIVDVDAGHGNALNAAHAIRTLERAGAAGVQIEDQTNPKRCGHLVGKEVVSRGEMVARIAAMVEARRDPDTLLIARTDALATHGLDEALARGEAFLAAGADALFVEAPTDLAQMATIGRRFGGRAPLVHNFVAGGRSPVTHLGELSALGYRLGLFPLAGLQAAVPAQRALLAHLRAHGATADWTGAQADLHDLNDMLDLRGHLAFAAAHGETSVAASKRTSQVSSTPSPAGVKA